MDTEENVFISSTLSIQIFNRNLQGNHNLPNIEEMQL
jgi:hypothetical protein